MSKLKVEVLRAFVDMDEKVIAVGTVLDLDAALAAKFIKSGVVDIVVPDETPKKTRTPKQVEVEDIPAMKLSSTATFEDQGTDHNQDDM